MTWNRMKDRWEVKPCESCGWKRRVRVSYLYGPDKPSWHRDCDLCVARVALQRNQRRTAAAEDRLHKLVVARAKQVADRKRKPLNEAPREVVNHIRKPDSYSLEGLSFAMCGKQGQKLVITDPDESNCAKCKKAWEALSDAPTDHLLP